MKKKLTKVLALILAILLSASLTGCGDKEEKKAEEVPQAPSVEGYFSGPAVSDIVSMQVNNGETTYTIINGLVPDIEGYTSLVINPYSLYGMLMSTEQFPYTGKVEGDISDLSKFGLKDSAQSVAITCSDKSVKTIFFGKEASEFEYYAMIDTENVVYTIQKEAFDFFMRHPSEHRDMQICNIDYTLVDRVTVEKNGEKEVSVELDENFVPENEYQTVSFLVTYPYESVTASLATVQYLFEDMESVVADSIVEENPADLSKYGLVTPAITVEIANPIQTTTLKFGNEKDGKVYIMRNDDPVVYLASCSLYNTVKGYRAIDYVENFVSIYNISGVSSIDITKGDKKYSMKINEASGSTTYSIDGKNWEESNFRKAYQQVIGIAFDNIVNEKAEGKVYATVKYNFKDSTSAVYNYYDYDNDSCIVVAKNALTCTVPKSSIDNMIKSITKE